MLTLVPPPLRVCGPLLDPDRYTPEAHDGSNSSITEEDRVDTDSSKCHVLTGQLFSARGLVGNVTLR